MTNTIPSSTGGGIDLGHGLLSDRLMSQSWTLAPQQTAVA